MTHRCAICQKELFSKKPNTLTCSVVCANKFRTRPAEDRFWEKVNKTENCWLWTGAISQGYGQFPKKGKRNDAHRYSWELHNGPIKGGLWVLHKCDVRACVRPDHLFLGTRLDNIADMVSKKRHAFGVKNGMAKLNPEKVEAIRRLRGTVKVKEIAILFGISRDYVYQICLGGKWQCR